jgi:tyrosinase
MNLQYLDAVTRHLATSRSRRQVLATTGRGIVGGVGAAMIARGFDLGLLDDGLAPTASAQGVTVRMLDFEYDPPTITVPVGTEVIWVNEGGQPHSATSNVAGTFDTGVLNSGDESSHTFTETGTFNYFCTVHGEGMSGVVEVVDGSPTPTQLYQRRSVNNLGAGAITLDSFATAIGIMKGWDLSTDVQEFTRSWRYQGNIHMTWDTNPDEPPPPDPLPAGWSTCEHFFGEDDGFTPYFLPWHRMYLYWFERIVRELSADASFALPYWDTSVPGNRVPPAPFLDPTSHLFAEGRVLDPSEPASSFDPCLGITSTVFDNASSRLEATPHGDVHVWVGGMMLDPRQAARDPVFWLHHANIDRLWESWLALGNANPSDSTWLDHEMNDGNNLPFGVARPYNFFDETGTQVTTVRVVKEVVTTAVLGYEYDALFDPEAAGCLPFLMASAAGEGAVAATPSAGQTEPVELGVNAPEDPIEIGPVPTLVPVALNEPTAALAAPSTTLTLEGIRGQGVPSVTVEVYINLPEGQEPDYRSPYYVGNLNLFGLLTPHDHALTERGSTQRFDIERNIRALEGSGEWTADMTVTFVPYYSPGSTAPDAAVATAQAVEPPPGPWVTVESVALTAQ